MNCENIKNSLMKFFNDSIKIESSEKDCRIVFPIYGRDNDLVELSVRKSSLGSKGKYYITDDAENISQLYLYGMQVDKEGKPKSIIDSIEKTLDVEISDGEIKAYANDNNLGLVLSKIISSILSVQHIQYLSRPKNIVPFKQKVKIFLDEKAPDYSYFPKVKGISGEESHFDFGYPQHSLFIDTLYGSTEYSAFEQTMKTCMKAVDVTRLNNNLKIYAIYDNVDEESKDWWSAKAIHYMENFLSGYIPWDNKEQILEILDH